MKSGGKKGKMSKSWHNNGPSGPPETTGIRVGKALYIGKLSLPADVIQFS